jgi:hypothetical protein
MVPSISFSGRECRHADKIFAFPPRTEFSVTTASEGPQFHFTEKPGPYAVGLKVVDQYDFSRTYRTKIDAEGKPTVGERAGPATIRIV